MNVEARQAVAVVDDDRQVLSSLVEMLSIAGFETTGYASPVDFLRALPTLAPCCVIADLRMPRVSGLTLIERMKSLGYGHWPVIVISGYADIPVVVSAMQLGASTFLEKPFRPGELIDAIRTAQSRIRKPVRTDPAAIEANARFHTLTSREKEVFSYAAAGKSSKAAAVEMGLSPRTIEAFRASILRKTGARNITALAGLVRPIAEED
ncbi:response regulator [Brevundimonas sp.]|uniref:response regulator transcription factor n=1 Tax=Brevundimonas sp. TaxID=1871086 RepID=UPI00286B3946|nr:response regulator [Brevundimonas sp.]